MPAQDGLQGVIDQGALSATTDAGDADELPQGEIDIDALQIVTRGATQAQQMAVARAPASRHRDALPATQIIGCERGMTQHVTVSALKDDLASAPPCPRADVHNIVGIFHHLLIVLDHNNGVAHVAKVLQRTDEADVVSLMQADAGLVQNIEDIHQLAAYLGGKAYALALAARKADGGTCQREIFKPDVEQEPQSRAYLLQNLGSNLALMLGEMCIECVNPLRQGTEIHRSQLHDVLASDAEVERLPIETQSVAGRALGRAAELLYPLLSRHAHLGILHLLDVLYQSVEIGEIVVRGLRDRCWHPEAFGGAVEDFIDCLVRHLGKRGVERAVILLQHGLNLPENHRLSHLAQRRNAPFAHTQGAVGDHLIDINEVDIAQPLATRTGSLRTVEREIVRSWVLVGNTARGAHQALAVIPGLARVHIEYHNQSIALAHGIGHRLSEALLVLLLNL